ncbi:MAG: CopG family transcriptional regulator [Thermoplasmata archaeon]|nr:CopG family transcriptional regulator [Thermoplasmata archaeon]
MKKQLPVYLTDKQIEQLKKESKRLGSSMGSIIRQAIMEYFSKRGGKP